MGLDARGAGGWGLTRARTTLGAEVRRVPAPGPSGSGCREQEAVKGAF